MNDESMTEPTPEASAAVLEPISIEKPQPGKYTPILVKDFGEVRDDTHNAKGEAYSMPVLSLRNEKWFRRAEVGDLRQIAMAAGFALVTAGTTKSEPDMSTLARVLGASSCEPTIEELISLAKALKSSHERETRRSVNRRNQCKTMALAHERLEARSYRYIERCWTAEKKATELRAQLQDLEANYDARLVTLEAELPAARARIVEIEEALTNTKLALEIEQREHRESRRTRQDSYQERDAARARVAEIESEIAQAKTEQVPRDYGLTVAGIREAAQVMGITPLGEGATAIKVASAVKRWAIEQIESTQRIAELQREQVSSCSQLQTAHDQLDLIENDRSAMRPVLEAAKAMRDAVSGRHSDWSYGCARNDLFVALASYETKLAPGTETKKAALEAAMQAEVQLGYLREPEPSCEDAAASGWLASVNARLARIERELGVHRSNEVATTEAFSVAAVNRLED